MKVISSFQHVRALVQHLGRPLTVYDLETTTLRGRANFGITEVACMMVLPERANVIAFGHLINPERALDPRAVAVTGITSDMVAGAQTWGVRYAKLFQALAHEHVLCGFNNHTFDNPALRDMGARYGYPIESFVATLDVRALHLRLTAATSRAGRLEEIAAGYGVHAQTALHRASADAWLTLETLDAMVRRYSPRAVAHAGGLGTSSCAANPSRERPGPDERTLGGAARDAVRTSG
jgi:DNA polymerase-3 subunit epsilon